MTRPTCSPSLASLRFPLLAASLWAALALAGCSAHGGSKKDGAEIVLPANAAGVQLEGDPASAAVDALVKMIPSAVPPSWTVSSRRGSRP